MKEEGEEASNMSGTSFQATEATRILPDDKKDDSKEEETEETAAAASKKRSRVSTVKKAPVVDNKENELMTPTAKKKRTKTDNLTSPSVPSTTGASVSKGSGRKAAADVSNSSAKKKKASVGGAASKAKLIEVAAAEVKNLPLLCMLPCD